MRYLDAGLWKFRCYVSARGTDEIRAWHDIQSARVRAKFRGRLRFLSQTPRSGWKREPFDMLHGYDIGEIRFNADGVEHRPLGFFSPDMTFTLVFCAKEKGGRFIPKNAPEIAEQRKRKSSLMYPVVASGPSLWSNELVRDLTDDEFRHEYMMDQVRSYIAFQIRALREQPGRRWSQSDLAKRSGKTQSVVSRIEDPDYGKLSLQSLLEIAIAFDLPLLVQFVEWDDWLARMSNLSPSSLRKKSFDATRLVRAARQPEDFEAAAANPPVMNAENVTASGIALGSQLFLQSGQAAINGPVGYVCSASTNVGISGVLPAVAHEFDLTGQLRGQNSQNPLPFQGISIQGQQPVFAQ